MLKVNVRLVACHQEAHKASLKVCIAIAPGLASSDLVGAPGWPATAAGLSFGLLGLRGGRNNGIRHCSMLLLYSATQVGVCVCVSVRPSKHTFLRT